MKRFIGAALSAALALTLAVPAAAEENKIGDVVGHTYYTDITAQIDGHPLPSYNIGGETAVVAEDLREYGFSVVWDGEARTLTVERDLEGAVTGDYRPQGQTQTVGAQAGDIYYTDIKTYVQGEKVESFALNGETAIRFSELSRAGTVSWNGVSREAALTLIQPWTVNEYELLEQRYYEGCHGITTDRPDYASYYLAGVEAVRSQVSLRVGEEEGDTLQVVRRTRADETTVAADCFLQIGGDAAVRMDEDGRLWSETPGTAVVLPGSTAVLPATQVPYRMYAGPVTLTFTE